LGEISNLLHLVHVLIEVLICGHLKQMEIICDFRQSAASTQLIPQPGNLVSLKRVSKRLHLPFLVDVLTGLTLNLLIVSIVPLLLIFVTLHDTLLCHFSSLVRLQRGHQFVSACNRLMEPTPDLLWLVHEWVFLGHFHSLDDVLTSNYVLVFGRQLEHLVGEALLGRLICLKFADVLVVL